MKAAVALVLVSVVLGSPVLMGQFLTGYRQASEDSCLQDPEACGRALGELTAFVGQQDLSALLGGITPAEANAFIQGFIQGLEYEESNVSACLTDFTQGNFQLQNLIIAIRMLMQDYQDWTALVNFACSGVSLSSYDFVQDCNFNTLWDNIKNLGFSVLLARYLQNSCDINNALVGLAHCSVSSLNWCGYSTGVIIRELLDWGI